MLVCAAVRAPANRVLNKTSPGTVSFLLTVYTYVNFSENNFPD